MSLVLTGACAGAAAVGGLAVPRLVRAVPEPDPGALAAGLPEGEALPPSFADVAATPRLGPGCAVASAAAASVLASAVGPDPALVGLVPLVPVGVALAVVDARTRLLPRAIVLPATGALLVLAVVGALLVDAREDLLRAVAGLLVARSAYWVLWFLRSAGLGFGDVRLAALVGLALGWLGWSELLVGLYAGFLVFGVPGALLALLRRDASLLRTAYPFGPFLLVGALLGIVLGEPVARALG